MFFASNGGIVTSPPRVVAPCRYWSPSQILDDHDQRRLAYYNGLQDGVACSLQYPQTHNLKVWSSCECPLPQCENQCAPCAPCGSVLPAPCGIVLEGTEYLIEDDTPVQNRAQAVNQRYYPPYGAEVGPSTGLPVRVRGDGTVDLPLIDPVVLEGLSISEAVERVRALYVDKGVIQRGRERITIGLITPRVKRVVVLREDTPAAPVSITNPAFNKEIHRGSGEVIDLPIHENDVLHALASTGGLPGTDAKRELWVIRNQGGPDYRYINADQLNALVQAGNPLGNDQQVIKIPLFGCHAMKMSMCSKRSPCQPVRLPDL